MLFLLFFLILTRPPISTLFPYTTLFRSGFAVWIRAARDNEAVARFGLGLQAPVDREIAVDRFLVVDGESRPRDRKSTRLNSSHSQISYAVFCLKKKKKNTRVSVNVL